MNLPKEHHLLTVRGICSHYGFPILLVRKLIFTLMNHYVPRWLTSIDPNNCFIFKTHLQHYISVGRFLGMLLIAPAFLHVDPLRRIAKCTFGGDQFKLLRKSVLFFELTVTLMESEWWGEITVAFLKDRDFNMESSILHLII